MRLDDFDFHLPDDLIATRPAKPRSSARMLYAQGGQITDAIVRDLPQFLRKGDRLILNDTRVIPARLRGQRCRESALGRVSAKIEVTLLEPQADGTWSALAKPMRKLALGEVVEFTPDFHAEVAYLEKGLRLRFNIAGDDFDAALNSAGAMPLPPYIEAKRPSDAQDREDYQTIWAKRQGAVAAPTASLHFDEGLMADLLAYGVTFSFVTLHVGAGTFLPVTVEDVTTHKMHAEWGEVSQSAADEINATRAAGGRIIPVGTTALRLIETAASETGEMRPFEGDTDIFIYPGYRFKITDGLVTNFHLPKSTLMMLVSALMGEDLIRTIYDHAITQNYRFFSYGDASLLIGSQT
ncbi:MAG: tRNA preQ1(34) S-adenosylmethionine ribosyltransferase-isomerase QueA [Proteobacteria bacterium]|nr:tRNA preQ1(34) S-adenosylmethionine ribosyltransferase-isomerase QueA [Pseudomonadota bacterium]